jgi:hypothetical protein
MSNTAEQRRAALALVAAVAETIRESRSVPSGVLYASLLNVMSMQDYNATIDMLKRAKLVEESAHVLTWIGPVLS